MIFFTPEQIDIDDYTCTKNCGPPTNYSEAFIMYHKTLSTEIGATVRYVNYYVCIFTNVLHDMHYIWFDENL